MNSWSRVHSWAGCMVSGNSGIGWVWGTVCLLVEDWPGESLLSERSTKLVQGESHRCSSCLWGPWLLQEARAAGRKPLPPCDGEVSKRRWEAPFSDWLTFPYRAYMLFPFGVNDEMNISMTPVTQPWGLFKFLQLSQPASQPSARAYDVAVSSPESLPFGKSF